MCEMKKVNSTNINSIGYDEEKQILYVSFHSNSLYMYYDVPQEVYNEFLNSHSKGSYLYKNIIDYFDYDRIYWSYNLIKK